MTENPSLFSFALSTSTDSKFVYCYRQPLDAQTITRGPEWQLDLEQVNQDFNSEPSSSPPTENNTIESLCDAGIADEGIYLNPSYLDALVAKWKQKEQTPPFMPDTKHLLFSWAFSLEHPGPRHEMSLDHPSYHDIRIANLRRFQRAMLAAHNGDKQAIAMYAVAYSPHADFPDAYGFSVPRERKIHSELPSVREDDIAYREHLSPSYADCVNEHFQKAKENKSNSSGNKIYPFPPFRCAEFLTLPSHVNRATEPHLAWQNILITSKALDNKGKERDLCGTCVVFVKEIVARHPGWQIANITSTAGFMCYESQLSSLN